MRPEIALKRYSTVTLGLHIKYVFTSESVFTEPSNFGNTIIEENV